MTDGKKDQLKRKKTLEYELRRLYRAGELTDQQIAELKEAEFPFDAPVRRTAKSVVRIDDGKRWPSCSAAEKELGITQGWMSDVCNMAMRGKWVAIKNQFYCFESMYSPDMDLTEIRGLAGWIVNLETGEMFPTTTEAAKAAGTSRSVVLDHVKNKVKPQNKRFSYVRDWDGKVGRLVDLNVQMICLETDTIYHSYDEICAAIWSDGYGETRKEIVQKVGDGCRRPLDYSQRSSADNRSVIDPFGIDLYLPAISYLHISCSSLRHFWRDVGSAVFCAVGHGGGSLHLVPNFSKSWKPHSSLCCFMRIRSGNRL